MGKVRLDKLEAREEKTLKLLNVRGQNGISFSDARRRNVIWSHFKVFKNK